jgi:glyoxylase-like metal-dependent hydrolase (beta-lactamase superfamily II)/ferredoxin
MAKLAERLPENVEGDFFVDASCIDCGTCRMIAPETYSVSREREQSYVQVQPGSEVARVRARMALVACPTASIGDVSKGDLRGAIERFPEPIAADVSDVRYCGYAAESSYGARAWLVSRDAGNVLVDSPRAARPLLDRIDALGGVHTLFLTHRDDVADHARLRAHFGCERLMHEADVSGETREIERRLSGTDPIPLAPDLLAIPVPGHTRGSTALLVSDTFLFTGDHLWLSEQTGELHMSRGVCWYSWPEQLRSLERLLDHRFEWILPGHGRPYRAPNAAAMHTALERLAARLV